MIICSDHQQGPEIFPRDRVKLGEMIKAYKSKRVSDPRKVKSYGLCDFLKDSVNKMEKKRNLEAKFPTSLEFLDNSSQELLRKFANELGEKIEQVKTKKMSNTESLGLEGLLKMPPLNPNPITTMTGFNYNSNVNTSIMSDSHVESSTGSSITNVDNGFYPICQWVEFLQQLPLSPDKSRESRATCRWDTFSGRHVARISRTEKLEGDTFPGDNAGPT
uniref:Transcription factor, MADS-box n=1 Tax=Tanacetum cinerariifolium TaxID=118510 RepID=A0A6L2MMF1_TANCI|nr:transcription factor, MADS-box [Tanacetum cinerariifolium]